MLKPSPLKHTEGEGSEGHLILSKKAHDEKHGGEATENLPELKDITVFNTDNPAPPKSIEQKETEDKSTSARLENNTSTSFFPNQVEPSIQDNTNKTQPIHLADPEGENLKADFWGDTGPDDYKRKNNKWYLVKNGEEKEVGADPKTAGKKQTALLNNLNQSLWGGSKEINPKDPQTWIGKKNLTIAAGLRKSNDHPGIVVQDGSNNSAVIKLPNGKVFNINADDPEALKKYKEINDFYATKPPVGKDKDLLTSLQFNDDKDFNKAWGSAGYSMTGYGEKQVLKGPDGKEIDLSNIQSELQEGFDGGQFGRASIFDAARKYLHDNASAKDIAKIKAASIAETTKSIDVADVKRKALDTDVGEEGKNSYIDNGSFKNEMLFSLTGQQKEGTFDPNKPSTWGDEEGGGIVEGTGVSQSTLDMIDTYYEANIYNSYGEQKMLNNKGFTDLKPIVEKLNSIKEGEEGYAQAQADIKVMQNLLPQLDKTLKSGALKAKNEIIDGQLETYQAQQYRENENQILANMGSEFMEEESIVEKAGIDGRVDQMMGNYEAEIEKFETVIQSTAEDAGKDGVSVSYDGINFMVDGEDAEKVAFYKKKFSGLNKSMIKSGEDYSQTNADYKEKYKEWQNKHSKILDIENQSSREHNLFNINASKFGDGFRSMGYSALSLVDEQAAINKKQAMETGSQVGLEKPLDYRTALKTGQKWRFATGELATQGANSIVAIASGGIGMGLGIGATGTSMLTGYGVFGTFSGTQKYMDLTIQQQAGEEAKKGLANLEKFKGLYSPEDYMRTKMQYEKAIAFGDINADQKLAAAYTSFIVEGTITSFLGTVPNSINLIKKFNNPLKNMGEKLLRSDLKAFGAAAGQTGKGILGEIIEETSIEGLTTVGDGLILSREMDFSHLDDVAVTSIISAGPMTALPNSYAAITQQMQTAPYRKEVNGRLAKMKKLEEKFATLGESDGDYRSILTDQYKAEVEAIVGAHTGLEVDALALGADGVRKLLKGAVEENYLNQQAGITSKDNVKSIEKKRNAYKESLSKEAAKDYQDRLDAVSDQKKTLTEGIDYDGAIERIFGDKGIHVDNKLKNTAKYKKADKRGKLIMILDQVRKDKVDSNIQKAKNDPLVKKFVEESIYGEGGWDQAAGEVSQGGGGRKNRKAKEENAMYDDMANLLLTRQRTANITATEGNTNGKAILGDKRFGDLKVVDMNGDIEAMKAAIYDNDGFTVEEKQRIVDGLKSGKTKAAIIDNQYIVLDKEAADKNLANGDVLQGTVISHEISHFIDDASFENEAEKATYTHNLNGLISKNSPVVHELALERINKLKDVDGKPLYNESKTFEEQSIKYKDEYTKSVQDMFMDPAFENDFENVRKKSGIGIVNKARMALNKDFAANIDSEKTAGAWMVGFIDNFKEGNLSPLARRKMDAKNDKTKEKGINTSQEASEKVQDIYEKQGIDGAFDIIDQFKPIVGKIVQKRSEAPNFDRQLLTDEIETGKRGIYDLINEYKPESGVPLAAYINKYLPARAIEASRRVLGEEFTEDISERVDIAAEEVSQEPTQFKRKKIILSDRLNVKGKIDKAIKAVLPNLDIANLSFKTLKDQTPEITGEMFGISPKKLISGANITKKELQAAQMFISKNADVLIQMLPEGTTAGGTATGVPKTLLAPFYNKTDRAKMEKTGTKAGLAVQAKKPNISKAEFLEVFGIVDGVPNRTDRNTSARVLAIANQTGKMMTNQAVREQLIKNESSSNHVLGLLEDGKSKVMFSEQGIDTQAIGEKTRNLNEEIGQQLKEEQGAYKQILEDYKLDHINMRTSAGRKQYKQFWFGSDAMSKLPKSFYENMGTFTGTAKTIEKDNKALKEWDTIKEAKADKLHSKPWKELSKEQKVEVTRAMKVDGLPGKATKTEHAGNYAFKTVGEVNNAIKNAEESGGVFAKPDKDIENAVKKMSYGAIKKMTPAKQKAFNESKRRGMKKIWQIFEGMIQDKKMGGTNASMIAAMLASTSAYQGHFMRTASPIMFFNDIFGANVEEHTAPASDLAKFLLNRAIQGNIEEYYDGAVEGYFQGSLPKVNDKMLKGTGVNGKKYDYTQNSPVEFMYDILLGRKSVWIRYFNPNVNANNGGINPNSLTLLNGNSIAKEYGVAVDPSLTTNDVINKQQELLFQVFNGDITEAQAGKAINEYAEGAKVLKGTIEQRKSNANMSQAVENSRVPSEPRGITVLDFDDTLATSKSLIRFTKPDGTKGTLNAEQYAKTYQELTDLGYKWDFSEFTKVVDGKTAPLFNKAMKLQGKFGPENMFILTARPAESATAIFEFLQANGLNIPMENITGLGNSTGKAKADWIAGKVADGYNDFYFADDAMQNVKAVQDMLDQFDVKSKVQQAKVNFSQELSPTLNNILEQTTGIESEKVFSDAQAKIRGAKAKYNNLIPASAQDFSGLLYNFIGKGKQGETDMAFFKKALIDPFARAINEINASKQSAANDYKNLQKAFPKVKKTINKNIEGTQFTNDQAARVYLWNKAGFEVPGLSKRDLKTLVNHVEANPSLQAYADGVGLISKKVEGYGAPGDFWLAENITSDLLSDGAIGETRGDFLAEWQQNADAMFTPENLNKIEAIYGSKFREALEDVLYRMKTGRNRPAGGGRLVNQYMNWINNSVGAIMFLNLRSAALQTISATNYMNWSDNNPAKAALAFANQPQFWKDFSMIFNSDYLKQRRSGNQRGINEAELSAAVAGAENKAKAALNWLLKKGFLPTQMADSFAISMGGASFYRNRTNKYVKEGMTQVEAEKKAFLDLQETTEVNQQSARPDMISQQQASPLGRLILSFQNTPMQYARIMDKAGRDIINGRGDFKHNVSKIVYYGFAQSILFGALQSAIFASMGDDEEEDFDKKKERIINGMIDSALSGGGVGGKAIATTKNTIRTFLDQRDRGFRADHAYTLLQALSFSPPIGSKLRKIYSSIQTDKFNKDVFLRRGFTLDNPIWGGVGNVIEGVTNAPLGRISNMMLQLDNVLDSRNETWKRLALGFGWNTWDLGIKDPDIEAVKDELKAEKKIKSKEKVKVKKEKKKKEVAEKNKTVIEENKKKSKKDGICSAISKGGKRCKSKAINGGMCTVHEKAPQNTTGVKSQCKKIKDGGKRCGMKTSSKSGFCYYHD